MSLSTLRGMALLLALVRSYDLMPLQPLPALDLASRSCQRQPFAEQLGGAGLPRGGKGGGGAINGLAADNTGVLFATTYSLTHPILRVSPDDGAATS